MLLSGFERPNGERGRTERDRTRVFYQGDRDTRAWFPCGDAEYDPEYEYHRFCTGDVVCFRVSPDYEFPFEDLGDPKLAFPMPDLLAEETWYGGAETDFLCYSSALFHPRFGTFFTLEDLGDDLWKWIFVERDFEMLQLRLRSLKAVALHLHKKMEGTSKRKWILLTNEEDASWRGGRHTAADWLLLVDDLLDRLRTREGGESAGQMAPGIKTALENFASFIKRLEDARAPPDDESDDESDDEDDTPAKRRRTELVQKIGSVLDANTGAMKENDYRVAMDALKELM